jgi:enoyl-CoA hydratase
LAVARYRWTCTWSGNAMADVRVDASASVATVTLDRPPVNAIATATYAELIDAFKAVGARKEVSAVVVLSASERVFSAGADIKELDALAQSGQMARDEERQRLARTLFDLILNLPQPTVVALNGPALGTGAVIAACCDIRYASERATIGLTEINVGRCGGGRHLMRHLPQGTLREMYFTGRPLDAAEAYRLGLVQRLLPHGQERDAAVDLAREIASKSPLAVRMAKEALNRCESLPVAEGYTLEQTYTLRLGQSEDAREAMRAFVEKRPPVWSGS